MNWECGSSRSFGAITAIRFWKALNDTAYISRIWSNSGTLLTVTFSGESGSGWQQQALASALPVQAGTTYIVSVNIGSQYPFTSSVSLRLLSTATLARWLMDAMACTERRLRFRPTPIKRELFPRYRLRRDQPALLRN
jgi:hypothetical protein